MRSRWVAIVALGAMVQVVLPVAARADQTETEEETEDETEETEEESGPRVILRIDRPTARLQQRTMLGWRNICIPPCGAVVDPEGTYRIAGGGAVPSPPFGLPRESGDVFVEGRVGSKAKRIVGLCFMLGGLVTAGYSAYTWSVNRPTSEDARILALWSLGVQVILGLTGAALMTGGRTSLRVR